MRKTRNVVALFLLALGAGLTAFADQITFSFVSQAGNLTTVVASSAGLTAGPALNVLVTDSTTGVSDPLSGLVNMSTGPASSFTVLPTVVVSAFTAGGSNSVSIVNPITLAPILSGTTNDNSTMVATYPGGTGAFLAGFHVTFVDPSILAAFGLKTVDPRGSLSLTFGQDVLTGGKTINGVAGGGSITVTATPTPEPASLGLLGGGMLVLALASRLYRPGGKRT